MNSRRMRREYEESGAVVAYQVDVFRDWIYSIMNRDIDQYSRMTQDNCAQFKTAFGEPSFTFMDSDRRRLLVWRFALPHGCWVWVFTHDDRGTSYEVAKPPVITTWNEVGKMMIEFMKETIWPAINKGDRHG
jgi:hypothetical protein